MSEAAQEFQLIEPERFSMAGIARACWNVAVEDYDRQMDHVARGIIRAPYPFIITRAFTLAAASRFFDTIERDPKGFLRAMKRVKEGGKFK